MQKRIEQRLAVVRHATHLALAAAALTAGAAHAGLDLTNPEPPKAAQAASQIEGFAHHLAFPQQAVGMCMGGVCLGQSIDKLPAQSMSLSGARVPGQWFVQSGSSKPVVTLQGVKRLCSAADLPSGALRQVQLAFAPRDTSKGGMTVVAEALPVATHPGASVYTVTKIVSNVQAGTAEDGVNLPVHIGERWPHLQPTLKVIPSGEIVVDHWGLRGQAVKPASGDKIAHEVRYTVRPFVSFDTPEIAAKTWPGQPVNHTLAWNIGLSDAQAWDLLSNQPGCVKPAIAEPEKAVPAPVAKPAKAAAVKKVAPVKAVAAKLAPVEPAKSASQPEAAQAASEPDAAKPAAAVK